MIPVILSGGSGTRLWPASRTGLPKQFVAFFASDPLHFNLRETLFAKAVSRLTPWLERLHVVTVSSLNVITDKSLAEMGIVDQTRVLCEPEAKNTAAAIAYLCRDLELRGLSEEVVGVFPADHLVSDVDGFRQAVSEAEHWAQQGDIVTLGIRPTYPATGYGYIELDGPRATEHSSSAMKAIRFREKPDVAQAKEFLASGRFLWNAGMFVFQAKTMLGLLKRLLPEVAQPFESLTLKSTPEELAAIYKSLPSVSIDYGVFEKLPAHTCIPASIGWNDVGTWDSLSSVLSKGETLEVDGQGSWYWGPKHRICTIIGADDLLVVETEDALLISKRGESERVREITSALSKRGDERTRTHGYELRPWGRFEVLRDNQNFKSKVIRVDPGARISYQAHAKRAEHWVIVAGEGLVTLNEDERRVRSGDHVFVPVGAKHRIANCGASVLEFVEVQIGSYFGEDDIVRFQDDYKRG